MRLSVDTCLVWCECVLGLCVRAYKRERESRCVWVCLVYVCERVCLSVVARVSSLCVCLCE